MFQPAIHVAALRIMMGPVNHPTPLVPLVLAVKADALAVTQVRDAWRQIDVVSDQNGLPRGELKNEFLVAAALVVVRL